MAQADDDTDPDSPKNSYYVGDPKDPSSYKRFPKKPSTWDYVKEAFEPTSTRAMLDQVRRRRQGLND